MKIYLAGVAPWKENGLYDEAKKAPQGKRIADAKQTALINYIEWIKFQKYAETHLWITSTTHNAGNT